MNRRKRFPWSPKEDKVLRDYFPDNDTIEVAKQLLELDVPGSRTYRAIEVRAGQLKIRKTKSRRGKRRLPRASRYI